MSLGGLLAELGLGLVLECVLYGLSYWTGFLVLKVSTLGTLNLAPLLSIGKRRKRKQGMKKPDLGVWVSIGKQRRALSAEVVCLVGVLTWIVTGVVYYLLLVEA